MGKLVEYMTPNVRDLAAGFYLAHKNVHFDPFWPRMTPKLSRDGTVMSPKIHKYFSFLI